MCNLYRLDAPANQIATVFGAHAGSDPWTGGYVAPGKFGPIIITGRDGGKIMVPRLWGVPPPPKGDRPVTNVRNLDSPFWTGTLRHPPMRCLIPVTRFQEWGGVPGARTQHWFSIPNEPIFAIAGIMRDSEIASFAMLTTDANPLVARVHPKAMPAILRPEDHDVWLKADWRQARTLVESYPSQLMAMEAHPIAGKAP